MQPLRWEHEIRARVGQGGPKNVREPALEVAAGLGAQLHLLPGSFLPPSCSP